MAGVSVGDTVAGCRIDAVAGHGGMGIVFRATQLRLGRPVALKAIAPDLALNASYRERFQREARLTASIEHPNVIPVYEADELETGELYLVMRWVEGTDLRVLLATEHRVAPERAVRLLAQVALALDAAHARGLVHRDVKPGNVLITTGSEHVYLTDFGIARGPDEDGGLTRTGVFVGTLAYASPERLEEKRGEPPSDIYALGCVLYETLTGRPPFNRASEIATINAHLLDPIPSVRAEVPEVPAALDGVVRVALAKDPEKRFSSAAEMAAAMVDAVAGRARATETTRPPTTAAELAPTVVETAPGSGATVQETAPGTAATSGLAMTEPPDRAAPIWRHRSVLGLGALALGVLVAVAVAVVSGGGNAGSSGSKSSRSASTGGQSSSVPTVATSPTPGGPAIHVASLDELPGGRSPAAVALVGSDAAVADPPANQVVIVHRNGRPPTTVTVGPNPTALAADPRGRLWIADSGSGEVRVIDPSSLRHLATIPVGVKPSGIAICAGTAWVADQGSNDVRAIDVSALRRSGRPIPTGGRAPIAIACGADGTVWVANQGSSDVTMIRSGRPAAPQFIDGGPVTVTAGAAGAWIGTANGNVVNLGSSGRISGQPLAFHAGVAMVALVGRSLWVATRDDGSLSLIPTAGAGNRTILERASLSPAESPVALACRPHICVATDPATHQVVAASF